MITLLALQFAAVFLFLAVRALFPELFVVRRRYRASRPIFAECRHNDSMHSAGMGMMIR
ncbi:MAG: hypothetical protein JSS86_00530 [Cyanobacteria bacterium SZAS LIN-2]|nr:hypothetical protein [Cyanobacteria bacterium SZAS LIN-3]MBS1994754.1 hypothetical protein [Cyanobacteria bacterium SZAS LIN-2]